MAFDTPHAEQSHRCIPQAHERHVPVHCEDCPSTSGRNPPESSGLSRCRRRTEPLAARRIRCSALTTLQLILVDHGCNDLDRAKLLTARLKRCSDWRQLGETLRRHGPCNHIHVSAAFSLLARLMPQPELLLDDAESRLLYDALCSQLLADVARCTPSMRPRELSNVLGACAKLSLRPELDQMDVLVDTMHQLLPDSNGQDCGSVAWALAKLKYHPSPSWLAAFSERCQACAPTMDAQALSNLLWAFARWDCSPPRELLSLVVDRAGSSLPRCSPQALSNLLWGMARQKHRPSPEWMDAFWDRVDAAVMAESISAEELSMILFSAGKLDCALSRGEERRLLRLFSHLEAHVHELRFSGAAYAMWGLGVLGHRPPASLLTAMYAHTGRMLDAFVSEEEESVAASITDGGREASQGRESGLTSRPLRRCKLDSMCVANAIFAVYRLGAENAGTAAEVSHATAQASWLRSAVCATTVLMPSFDARGLAVSGLCLAKMGAAVDGPWRSAYLRAVSSPLLDSMNAAELANVACTLCRLRQLLPADVMCSLLTRVHNGLLRFRTRELATTLRALAHLSRDLVKREEEQAAAGHQGLPQWRAISGTLWRALMLDVRSRWESLPPESVGEREVRAMRGAALLVEEDCAWLGRLRARVAA